MNSGFLTPAGVVVPLTAIGRKKEYDRLLNRWNELDEKIERLRGEIWKHKWDNDQSRKLNRELEKTQNERAKIREQLMKMGWIPPERGLKSPPVYEDPIVIYAVACTRMAQAAVVAGGVKVASLFKKAKKAPKVQSPLKPLHPDTSLSKASLDYWGKKSTPEIIDSLKPGRPEALRVKPDGTIMNGNTRIKILKDRGVDVNSLPREPNP